MPCSLSKHGLIPPAYVSSSASASKSRGERNLTKFERDRNTVCVMNASCRLGVSLVERLLRRGYTVHAATYDRGSGSRYPVSSFSESEVLDADWVSPMAAVAGESGGSLRRLSGENRRLKLFHADPLDYQTIVDAMKGCAGLFYTFEPPQDQSYDVSGGLAWNRDAGCFLHVPAAIKPYGGCHEHQFYSHTYYSDHTTKSDINPSMKNIREN
ncbi:hypothetical protein BHE74_00001799 [Ensete ventricosum]|nr:hypothetical protein BHE74_00001799 [Ensete ventricosum]